MDLGADPVEDHAGHPNVRVERAKAVDERACRARHRGAVDDQDDGRIEQLGDVRGRGELAAPGGAVEHPHHALDDGDVRTRRAMAEERRDQLGSAEEGVEVAARAARRERVIGRIDVVGPDLEALDRQPRRAQRPDQAARDGRLAGARVRPRDHDPGDHADNQRRRPGDARHRPGDVLAGVWIGAVISADPQRAADRRDGVRERPDQLPVGRLHARQLQPPVETVGGLIGPADMDHDMGGVGRDRVERGATFRRQVGVRTTGRARRHDHERAHQRAEPRRSAARPDHDRRAVEDARRDRPGRPDAHGRLRFDDRTVRPEREQLADAGDVDPPDALAARDGQPARGGFDSRPVDGPGRYPPNSDAIAVSEPTGTPAGSRSSVERLPSAASRSSDGVFARSQSVAPSRITRILYHSIPCCARMP